MRFQLICARPTNLCAGPVCVTGFGVHTFILQNEAGDEHLVKFHWIPKAGCISNLWDEQQKTAGFVERC